MIYKSKQKQVKKKKRQANYVRQLSEANLASRNFYFICFALDVDKPLWCLPLEKATIHYWIQKKSGVGIQKLWLFSVNLFNHTFETDRLRPIC